MGVSDGSFLRDAASMITVIAGAPGGDSSSDDWGDFCVLIAGDAADERCCSVGDAENGTEETGSTGPADGAYCRVQFVNDSTPTARKRAFIDQIADKDKDRGGDQVARAATSHFFRRPPAYDAHVWSYV